MTDALDLFHQSVDRFGACVAEPVAAVVGEHGLFPPADGAGEADGFGDVGGAGDVVEVGQRVAGGLLVAGAVDGAQLLLSVNRP